MFACGREIHPHGWLKVLGNEVRIRFMTDKDSPFSIEHEDVVMIGRDVFVHHYVTGIDLFSDKRRENFFAETIFADVRNESRRESEAGGRPRGVRRVSYGRDEYRRLIGDLVTPG